MTAPARLHPDDLERLAERLADLVADRLAQRLQRSAPAAAEPPPAELVDANEVARRFAVSAEFVRDHADELGVVRLGDGPRPRLRFDVATVAERLAARSASEGSQTPQPTQRRRRSNSRPRSTSTGRPLLPVAGVDD